jgi:hypothetical protein
MQGTAPFHHDITGIVLPQPEPVLHDATALDAAVDMLDPSPAVMPGLISPFLLPGQRLATWCLAWHEDLHVGQPERQEAQILQPALGR